MQGGIVRVYGEEYGIAEAMARHLLQGRIVLRAEDGDDDLVLTITPGNVEESRQEAAESED